MPYEKEEATEKIYYKVLDNKMQNFSYHRILQYKMNEWTTDPMERGLYVFADLENVITELIGYEERKVQLVAGEIKIFKCLVKNIVKEYDRDRHYNSKRGTRVEQVKIIGSVNIDELWNLYEERAVKFKEWIKEADSIESVRSYISQYDRDHTLRDNILRLKNLSLIRELSDSLIEKNPAVKEKVEEYWNLFDNYSYLFESLEEAKTDLGNRRRYYRDNHYKERLPKYFNDKRQSFSDLLLLAEGQIYERRDLPDRVLTETNCSEKLIEIVSDRIEVLKKTIPLLKLMVTRELSATKRLKTRMKTKVREFESEVDQKLEILEKIKAKIKDDPLIGFPKPKKDELRRALKPYEDSYSFEVKMKSSFGYLARQRK